MRNTSDHFDIFVRNTIKDAEPDILPPDWSEVEILLKHKHKSVSESINKKSILVAGGIIIVALMSFGVLKWAQFYSSLAEKSPPLADTAQQVLTPSDSVSSLFVAETSQVITQIDTLSKIKNDSTTFVRQKQKSDSLVADFKKKQSEREKQKPITKEKEKSLGFQTIQKTEKKNLNISSLAPSISDSDNLDDLVLPSDTTEKEQ